MTGKCPFCDLAKLSNRSWMVMWEPFPVNIGHMKLMPQRHNATWENLTAKEERDFFKALKAALVYLKTSLGSHKPDGFNVGWNIGEAAGQTIPHIHVHIIPRYKGDVQNPRGGVRNIKDAIVKW